MSLALAIACKDEAQDLRELVESSRPFVDEVVVIADPDSADDSVAVARKVADRVYELRFPGSFGELCTLLVHLCFPHEWSIRLDCDERIEAAGWARLRDRVSGWAGQGAPQVQPSAIALPRRRWADRAMTTLVEPGPDWQVRLVPVRREARFLRRVHPDFTGLPVEMEESGDAWIEHFHDLKSPELLRQREQLYINLARHDGIAVEGGQSLAAVCVCGDFRHQHAGAFKYAKPPFKCCADCDCDGFAEAE